MTPEPTDRPGGRHPAAQAVVVRLIRPAFEDLQGLLRKDPQIVRWALKKMLLLERDPEGGEPLRGALIGWRKIVVGDRDWRIVWRVLQDGLDAIIVDVAEVWAVGARSDAEVYAEMTDRASRMKTSPGTLALNEVIERLGKAGRGLTARAEPQPREKLPDWLIERLTMKAGRPAAEVAELSLEQALDAWTDWTNRSSR